MQGNPILNQLRQRGNLSNQSQVNPLWIQQLKSVMGQIKNSPNPQAALMTLLQNNPNLQSVHTLLQMNNGNLQQVAQTLAQQRGIDLNTLLAQLQ